MKIIYGFSGCSDKKYKELVGEKAFSPAQKYHQLLLGGFAGNGANVKYFSGLMINRSITKKLFIKEDDEEENEIEYHYINSINLPVLRQLCVYFGARRYLKNICKNAEGDAYVMCDCLNIAISYAALKEAKKKNIPLIYVVTDIPEFQRGRLLKKINDKIISGADGFIFLTKQMNEKVNPHKKPYIVSEGHSDGSLSQIENSERYEYKDGKKVVIYAGSLKKIYGVKNLVKGFISADIKDVVLRIYGDGDYRQELEELCKTHKNIDYAGVKANSDIVYDEQKASLLIEPRPSDSEYTKYSFPSKIMEYLASGAPVMVSKLPGMPSEYYPYIFTIDDESEEGIAAALKDFFSLPDTVRYEKGEAARRFVIKEKSNTAQAKRIMDFLQNEIKK